MSAADETNLRPLEKQEGISSLGEFDLRERLGQGAMGEVYKARQRSLDRIVALKMLSSQFASNPNFIERFRREARVAASLNHPNIIHLHTAGEERGVYYYAMEFVDGESLRQRLDREKRLPPEEALGYIAQAARGLAHAWQRAKIIHRDIKPDNLMLARDGTIKIADLGLAKPLAEDGSLTVGHWQMGTPNYVSPEQAAGKDNLDLRSDIYSLGATLFHLVTGKPPFEGATAAVIMTKHLSEPLPDPLTFVPKLNPRVAEIIKKMMAKDPNARYQTYEELLADLDPLIARRGIEPKSLFVFCLLAFGFGWLGVHRFYLGYKRSGLILLALGLASGVLNTMRIEFSQAIPSLPSLRWLIGALVILWVFLDLVRGLFGNIKRDARGLPLKKFREGF